MKTTASMLLACCLYGVASPWLPVAAGTVAVGEGASAREPIKTADLKFSAFNRHDAAAIEALYASQAVLQSPDHPQLLGNTKIADTYRGIFEAIPDARDSIVSIDSVADRVYVQFVMSGHLKDAGNKPISVRIMSVYTIKDHRIVSDWTYYDRKAP